MFEANTFGKTMDLLHRSMDVSMLRRSVIANNIANADTPNFKRSSVNFESQLEQALASEKPSKRIRAYVTDERHMSFERPTDYRDVKPKRVLDYLTTSDNNGNNVDLEEEMMQELQNQMRYDLMVKAVNHEFQQVATAVRAG